jgi:hypothetical protein
MGKTEARIVPATQAHIDAMKGRLRTVDAEECMAATGTEQDRALQQAYDISSICWIGLDSRGVPCAAFGVARLSLLGGTGVPWLLATDEILTDPGARRLFRSVSRYYVRAMLSRYNRLENYVLARNTVAIRWLKWCGFNMDAPAPFGIERKPFRRFWMDKGESCAIQ